MQERAAPRKQRWSESDGDSWYAGLAEHPIKTGWLLGLAAEKLARSDKVSLTRIDSTSVGRLLNALSLPIMLVDRSLRIVFANQACGQNRLDRKEIVGRSANAMFRGKGSAQRFGSLLEGVFATRKPLVALVPVRVGTEDTEARLHVHAVRFGRKRLLLVIVEKLTIDWTQQETAKGSKKTACTTWAELGLVHEMTGLDANEINNIESVVRGEGAESKISNRTAHMKQSDRHSSSKTEPQAIVICDLRGRSMYANDSFTRLFSTEFREVPGPQKSSLKDEPSDTLISKILAHMAHTASQEPVAREPYTDDESSEIVNVNASPFIDQEGRSAGMMFLLEADAQSRRLENAVLRNEETTRALLESVDDAMVLVDTRGVVMSSNEAFARRVGLPVAKFVGRRLVEFFPDHLVQARIVHGREAINTGKPVRFSDNNNGKHLENVVCPLFDANGKVESLAIISRDVTDQVGGISELQTIREKAEIASRAKSEFLANVSHELRTPLNAIIGFSEILEDQLFGELNEKQLAYVGHVLSSGRQLLQLIDNILDLANVESGQMELQIAGVDIRRVLESCMVLIMERARKRRLDIRLTVSDDLANMRIEADQAKLKQIVFNLLSNATKFTPPGGEIGVHAFLHDDEVVVQVLDTGIGLKPEDYDRVFGAFEQVDSSPTRRHAGTGLGLALARQMVELHGGRIWVESQGEGLGSTFSFAIPVFSPLPHATHLR